MTIKTSLSNFTCSGESSEVHRLYDSLQDAINFIHRARSDDTCPGVLVHCAAGRQRSAAVVAAYLMWLHGSKPSDAIAFVKRIRPAAFFGSVNFQGALDRWHLDLQKTHGLSLD